VYILANRKRKYITWAKCIAHVAEAAATHSYHCDVRSYRRVSLLWLTVLGKISHEWGNTSVITYYKLQQFLDTSQQKEN